MNHQLAIAVHILGFLASRKGMPVTSEALAETYGTSPVVLRRVLAKLHRAGLVESRRGVGGGSVLSRDPAEINMREAYEALSDKTELLRRPPAGCARTIGPVIAEYIGELYADAEHALLLKLEAVTVAEMGPRTTHPLQAPLGTRLVTIRVAFSVGLT